MGDSVANGSGGYAGVCGRFVGSIGDSDLSSSRCGFFAVSELDKDCLFLLLTVESTVLSLGDLSLRCLSLDI